MYGAALACSALTRLNYIPVFRANGSLYTFCVCEEVELLAVGASRCEGKWMVKDMIAAAVIMCLHLCCVLLQA